MIEPAGEMWSVVTESPSATRQRAPAMSSTGVRLGRHAVEVRRPPDVGRRRIPGEELALGNGQRAPRLVAGEDVGVRRAEHLLADRACDRLAAPRPARARCREEDVLAVRAVADRLGQRGRCPSARRARTRRRAAARRGSSPSPPGGCAPRSSGCRRGRRRRRGRPRRRASRDRLGQRAGVPDAGRAAVADGVEAELLEVRRQARLLVVLA